MDYYFYVWGEVWSSTPWFCDQLFLLDKRENETFFRAWSNKIRINVSKMINMRQFCAAQPLCATNLWMSKKTHFSWFFSSFCDRFGWNVSLLFLTEGFEHGHKQRWPLTPLIPGSLEQAAPAERPELKPLTRKWASSYRVVLICGIHPGGFLICSRALRQTEASSALMNQTPSLLFR